MRRASFPLAVVGVAVLTVLGGCSFEGGVDVVTVTAATSGGPATGAPPGADTPTADPGSTATDSPPPTGSAPATAPPTTPPTTTAPSTTAPVTTTPATEPSTVTACTSAQLTAELATDTPAPESTTLSGTVSLTNLGRTTCRLKGFGGLALSRSDGAPVLSRQQRTDASAGTVTLAPGAAARSPISWSRVANPAVGEPTTGDCEAVPTSLLVIPPNQIDELAVPWNSGPVCDQGTITQSPYTGS